MDIEMPALKNDYKTISNHRYEEAKELYDEYNNKANGDIDTFSKLIDSSNDRIKPFIKNILYNDNPSLFFDMYGEDLGDKSLKSLRNNITKRLISENSNINEEDLESNRTR